MRSKAERLRATLVEKESGSAYKYTVGAENSQANV
jgi:hypothetical protein